MVQTQQISKFEPKCPKTKKAKNRPKHGKQIFNSAQPTLSSSQKKIQKKIEKQKKIQNSPETPGSQQNRGQYKGFSKKIDFFQCCDFFLKFFLWGAESGVSTFEKKITVFGSVFGHFFLEHFWFFFFQPPIPGSKSTEFRTNLKI